MRVLKRRGELDLSSEALDVDAGRHLRWQHLDHHAPLEGSLLREEHSAHPAATKLLLDAVGLAERGFEALPEVGHHRQDTTHGRGARESR